MRTMRKEFLFIAGLFLVLLASGGFAQQFTPTDLATTYQQGVVSTCLDNGTIMNSLTVLRCVDNNCNTIVANATHTCQFGCNAKENPNRCNPAPFQVNVMLMIVGILIVLIIIGAIAWAKGH